jgi:hypothetical protein
MQRIGQIFQQAFDGKLQADSKHRPTVRITFQHFLPNHVRQTPITKPLRRLRNFQTNITTAPNSEET